MYSHVLLACVVLSCVHTQDTTIDPSVLDGIFGTPPNRGGSSVTPTPSPTPPPTPRPYTNGLENITVKPTEGIQTVTNPSGETCQCLPYYLCDANRIAIDANNATVTGWGELDIRFGEDDGPPPLCQESVEVCCKIVKDQPEIVKPQPDPSKLRGCGYRNPKGLGASIIGTGREAQFGEYPWVVALIDNLNGSYVGVGVIIHPQVIMTGAHVASKYGPNALKIRAGEWDTQTIKEIFEFEERTVQEVYYHAEFKPKSLKNDIALLRLESPLQLAEHINMLCLPDHNENFDNSKNCVANGWGKDTFGLQGRYAVILKKVEQDMVAHARCESLLQRTRLGRHFKLHSSFLCAGGEEGKDTCQGDGGAPLACPIGDDRYKLTGLVAWGIGCGMKDVPGVFTHVAAFRPWIDAKMEEWGYGTHTYTI